MKPIIFSTPMVQAILDGRKTVTRRAVKPQPTYITTSGRWKWPIPKSKVHQGCCTDVCTASREWWEYLMPDQMLYNPGDILWVRETWQEVFETEHDSKAEGFCVNIREWISNFDELSKVCAGLSTMWSCASMEPRNKYYVFKASDIAYTDDKNQLRWRPSIFMPREAARIFLRVTDVRAERLQDITVEDVMAEGLKEVDNEIKNPDPSTHESIRNWNLAWAQHVFRELWDSLNAKRGYGWDTSPWVWVISFERCEKP